MANKIIKEQQEWALVESHIEPIGPQSNPQADIKETFDIGDVLSKLETERKDKNAEDAPQAWFPSSPYDAPIFVPSENGMHVDPGSAPEAAPDGSDRPPLISSTTIDSVPKEVRESSAARKPIPRVFGLKKSTFYILFTLTIILILLTIGGTIGGVLAGKNKKEEETSSTPPASKYRMTFTLQTWEYTNQTGRSQIFYTPGQFRTAFQTRAYSWEPGAYNDTSEWTVCTMSFCLGDHQIGYWGASPHVGLQANWKSPEYGDVMVIKCARTFADPGCPAGGTSDSQEMFATAPVFDPGALPTPAGGDGTRNSTTTTTTGVSARTTGTGAVASKTGA